MFKYYLVIALLINITLHYRTIENSKIDYLVTPIKNDIYYKCRNQNIDLNIDNRFNCNSFPVTFNEIGAESTLYKDMRVAVASLKKF